MAWPAGGKSHSHPVVKSTEWLVKSGALHFLHIEYRCMDYLRVHPFISEKKKHENDKIFVIKLAKFPFTTIIYLNNCQMSKMLHL